MSQEENKFLSSKFSKQLLEFLSKKGALDKLKEELMSKSRFGKPVIGVKINLKINFLDDFVASKEEEEDEENECGRILLEKPLIFLEKVQETLSKVLNEWIIFYEDNLQDIFLPKGTRDIPFLQENVCQGRKDVALLLDTQKEEDQCMALDVEEAMKHFVDDFLFYVDMPQKEASVQADFRGKSFRFGDFDRDGEPNFDITSSDCFKTTDKLNCASNHPQFSKYQIHVRLKISNLPRFYPWKISENKNLIARSPRLALVSGLVLSHSLPRSYLIWTQYKCNSQCLESMSDVNLLTSSSNMKKFQNFCKFCGDNLTEDPSTRDEGEEMYVNLLLDRCANNLGQNFFGICPVIKILMKDDDIGLINLGSRIESTVIIMPTMKTNSEQVIECCETALLNDTIAIKRLPPILRKLAEDRSSSPWSLALTLAYLFCSDITPRGSFHRLKLAILLSLASCSTDESNIAVLAVGKCDHIHKRLFNCSAKFAPRYVYHSTLNNFQGKSSKTQNGNIWLEAGSLLRANGGVCVVDIFNVTKEASSICEVLENEEIQIKIPSDIKGCSRSFRYPLRTCIWSSFNPFNKRVKPSVEEDDTFIHVPVGELTKSVTDVFGLVIYTDSSFFNREKEMEEDLFMQILQPRTATHKETLLDKEDLLQYLEYARSTKITFTKEAEKLLSGYYVALRRLRGDCKKGVSVPVTAITTLTKVAKCHAKLSLRSFVGVGDAAAAILLLEESFTARSGFSPLGVTFNPHLPRNEDLHSLLGKKNDQKMKDFINNLNEFISEHTGDISNEF